MSAKHLPMGHSARKRDADEALRDQKKFAVAGLVAKELAALKTSGAYKQPQHFSVVDDFVSGFRSPRWRSPVLLIVVSGSTVRGGGSSETTYS